MPIKQFKPVCDPLKSLYLLWGDVKIGKTTFASEFPGVVFLATEAGLSNIGTTRWEAEDGRYVISSWEELCQATREVVNTKPSLICIDTADNAYFLLEQHICKKYGVEYKTDGSLSYGKGSSIINSAFRAYIQQLSSLGIGVILTSHSVVEERETRTGKMMIAKPSLSQKASSMILGMADFILYCTTRAVPDGDQKVIKRVMCTKPHPAYEAGDRTGLLPEVIDLDFEKFISVFKKTTPASATPAAPAISATSKPVIVTK
jgi:hypothetical protein